MLRLFLVLTLFFTFSFADEFESFEEEFGTQEVRYDPLVNYNENMTKFNDFVYTNAIRPVVKVYKKRIDYDLRFMIGNFFDNLAFPIRFVNNLLQGKFKNSSDELFRFVVNTTMGVGGFGDAGAEIFGVKAHKEDFGQTLGHYGMGSGFPVVLPFLGPSNPRDIVGLVGDYLVNPIFYLSSNKLKYGLSLEGQLNRLSFNVDDIELARKNVLYM